MAESVTISTAPPELQSMQYDFLREEGLKHIQNLAGKVWTDYNLSDPGINMLEVLSYAITDLGYRTSYPIPDILAQDPDPNTPEVNIRNFYTARQILPMNPVTINDYRKLLIDVDVHDSSTVDCTEAGVKNAWIDVSDTNEIPVYLNRIQNKLGYAPENPNQPDQINPRLLYNVLLELDYCKKFGDLNETTIERTITLAPCGSGTQIQNSFLGLKVDVLVEFPRWDNPNVDWTDIASIKKESKKLTLVFQRMPANTKYIGSGFLDDSNRTVWVSIDQVSPHAHLDCSCIANQIHDAIFVNSDSMLVLYQQKVAKIKQIVSAVRQRLMASRNLGEDFFNIKTLRVEEIAVCAEIDVSPDADVEQVLAQVYFEIEQFLSPTVYFYSLDDMFAKGKTSDEIFDGPPLSHGFIDNDQLESAQRKKVIHVSDLMSIIMDIPGVVAIKKIQIANFPEDNTDNIRSVSVRWCLEIAFEKNYIPRLSTELSSITFYKDVLPVIADEDEVNTLLDEMRNAAPPQRPENPVLDIAVPQGEFKDISEYVSVQDEFPLVYGIGPEGLPSTVSVARKAQAKQLKGFLMFFDQLLADYLSQLNGVKELFSMNGERDPYGDFVIDKSYFTQSLIPSVTGAASDLLIDPLDYPINLQAITENTALFESRRNKFLDHLMARFSEQFTDYAMLVFKINGKKANSELLVDKLELLNQYPQISSGRFKAFDYESPCELWSADNASGFEKRVSLLNGVAPRPASSLVFNSNITCFTNYFTITDFGSTVKFTSTSAFTSGEDVRFGVEQALINGINSQNYNVVSSGGGYVVQLTCRDGQLIGTLTPYAGGVFSSAPIANTNLALFISVVSSEFYNNPESNRNNLSCPIGNYMNTGSTTINMSPDPPTYSYSFTLYKNPFNFSGSNTAILTGTYTGQGKPKASVAIASISSSTVLVVNGNYSSQIVGSVLIQGSTNNDNAYTVVSAVAGTNITTVTLAAPANLQTGGVLGSIYYNTMSSADLNAQATTNKSQVLFDILRSSIDRDNYLLTLSGTTSRFVVLDRCKDTTNPVASSSETNFNSALVTLTPNHPCTSLPSPMSRITTSTQVKLSDSGTNNGVYTVTGATIDTYGTLTNPSDPEVIVATVTGSLTPGAGGGNLSFDGSFSVVSSNRIARTFTVSGSTINRVLFTGDKITIVNSAFNDGSYTVISVKINPANPSNSDIAVEEKIPDETSPTTGSVYYIKTFPVTKIDSAGGGAYRIFYRSGAGNQAIDDAISLVTGKFFSHEGMHIIEHILLRPKHSGYAFVPMQTGVNTLTTGLPAQGTLDYTKTQSIVSVNGTDNTFQVTGLIGADLPGLKQVIVKGSLAGVNDGTYTVVSTTVSGSNTVVKVFQKIPSSSLSPSDSGNFCYVKTTGVFNTTPTSIDITETDTSVDASFPVTINNSTNGTNNGTYSVLSVTPVTSSQSTVRLNGVKTPVTDSFLGVNANDDCEDCRVEDPYSFVMSVVLPYWQGKFINPDFKSFMERSLKLECPAHMVFNTCWVSNDQMQEFELKYKKWLLENSKEQKDELALSAALNNLIDILDRLRSVFPVGTLRDCSTDDSLKNSIILNQSALGSIQL